VKSLNVAGAVKDFVKDIFAQDGDELVTSWLLGKDSFELS